MLTSRRSLVLVLLLLVDCLFSRVVQFDVVPKQILKIVGNDVDSQVSFPLGQVGGLASDVQNPNRLYVFQRGTREWNAK